MIVINVFVLVIGVIVTAADVLVDPERDQYDPGDRREPARVSEVGEGVEPEDRAHERDRAEEVADPQDQAGGDPVEPAVRLLQGVGGSDGPAVIREHAVEDFQAYDAGDETGDPCMPGVRVPAGKRLVAGDRPLRLVLRERSGAPYRRKIFYEPRN